VLRAARIQVAGDIDELRAAHRVVTGPQDWPQRSGMHVISATTTAGRTVGLVRLDPSARIGPGLDEAEPTFDELALAYLATPRPFPAQVSA
jgi:ABC-2 type transport system ATP-binding protein